MKKIRSMVIMILAMALFVTGCGLTSTKNKLEKVTIQVPMGPPTAPVLYMKENNLLGKEVEVIIYQNMEEANVNIAKKAADITIMPVNVAAILYGKEMDISLLNVHTWGILHMIAKQGTIQSWDDLKGKDIYVGAQGASPDVLTQYLLEKNGLAEGDTTLQYSTSQEIAQKVIAGQVDIAVLPEPLLTQALKKSEKMEIIYDFAKEWTLITGVDLPQTGTVINNEFAKKHPNWVKDFQKAYAEAVEKVVADPGLVSEAVESEMGIPEAVFEEAMTRISLKSVSARDAKKEVEAYLEALFALAPQMIGGSMPNEGFYYQE